MAHEPGTLEVFVTTAVGHLAGGMFREYVEGIGLRGPEQVLDFGSGSGNPARFIAPLLQRGGGHLTCVDVSRRWMEVIRRRLRGYSNITYRLGDIGTLDIAAGSHDVILAHFVLHEIPQAELREAVGHLVRILRLGGRFFVREPLAHTGEAALRSVLLGAGLTELSAKTRDIKTQGRVFEAVYCK